MSRSGNWPVLPDGFESLRSLHFLVLNSFWDGDGLPLAMKFVLPSFASLTLWLLPAALLAAPIPDVPFWQDVAVRIHHAPELTNAIFSKLCVDKENTVYVLSSKGVARVFDDTLTLDKSYRPFAGRIAKDIALTPQGDLAYRFDEGWLSNGATSQQNPDTGPAWPSKQHREWRSSRERRRASEERLP